MEVNTLQEYLLTTELHSYIVGISSAIAFAFFWRFINGKPDPNKPRWWERKNGRRFDQE